MQRANLPWLIIILALLVAPLVLPSYWLFLATSATITAITLRSLGIVAGQTGMLALCQMSFVAIGAWVTTWLNIHDAPVPFVVQVLIGALAVVPFGVIIGLPTLRLRGVNLAVITLAFASTIDVVLTRWNFPGIDQGRFVTRGALLSSDQAYFWFCALCCVGLLLALEWLSQQRIGSAWLAVRHSERAAAALGLSVARTKLSAFALSAAIAGLAGGLLAGHLGQLSAAYFGPIGSIVIFALSTMIGTRYPEGAALAGLMSVAIPELMRRLGLPPDLADLFFGIGAVQALRHGASVVDRAHQHAEQRAVAQARTQPAVTDAPAIPVQQAQINLPNQRRSYLQPILEVRGLTVRYGQLVALDAVDLLVMPGTVSALIGPNGAGKSTLVDAITGFVPYNQGSIQLAGLRLDGLSVQRRVQAGLRRTFQQDRTIPDVTVGQYLQLAAGHHISQKERDDLLAYFDCPPPHQPMRTIDIGTRRLIEVAGALAARPMLLLLDEPAAGLEPAESLALGQRIGQIPHYFGCAVLLIEHDMALVHAASTAMTVLDFGRVLASGTPQAVLNQPEVVAAYLGDTLVQI